MIQSINVRNEHRIDGDERLTDKAIPLVVKHPLDSNDFCLE